MSAKKSYVPKVTKSLASSSSKRSNYELTRQDTESSEEFYWKCNKIQEETDEESVNNFTPRLAEEQEKEVNELEEMKNSYYMQKGRSNTCYNKDIYASKTTLETVGSSENKFELESDTTNYEKEKAENQLSMSGISSEGLGIEEKFFSPCSASKVPALNFSKIHKPNGVASLNSS